MMNPDNISYYYDNDAFLQSPCDYTLSFTSSDQFEEEYEIYTFDDVLRATDQEIHYTCDNVVKTTQPNHILSISDSTPLPLNSATLLKKSNTECEHINDVVVHDTQHSSDITSMQLLPDVDNSYDNNKKLNTSTDINVNRIAKRKNASIYSFKIISMSNQYIANTKNFGEVKKYSTPSKCGDAQVDYIEFTVERMTYKYPGAMMPLNLHVGDFLCFIVCNDSKPRITFWRIDALVMVGCNRMKRLQLYTPLDDTIDNIPMDFLIYTNEVYTITNIPVIHPTTVFKKTTNFKNFGMLITDPICVVDIASCEHNTISTSTNIDYFIHSGLIGAAVPRNKIHNKRFNNTPTYQFTWNDQLKHPVQPDKSDLFYFETLNAKLVPFHEVQQSKEIIPDRLQQTDNNNNNNNNNNNSNDDDNDDQEYDDDDDSVLSIFK